MITRSMLRLLHHLGGILFSLGLSLYVLFSHCALSSWSHLRNFHHFLHHLAIRDSTFSPKIRIKDDHSWGNEDHRIPPPLWIPSCLHHWNLHDLFYGLNLWNSYLFHNRHIYDLRSSSRLSVAEAQGESTNFWLELRVTSLSSEPGPFSQTESNVGVYLCKHRIYQLSSPDLVSFSSHPICTWLSLIWQCIEWNKGPQTMKPYSHHPMGHTTCSFTPLAPSRWFQSHSPPPVFPLAPALVRACASAQGCGCACPQTSDKFSRKMKRILSS